MGKHYMPFFSFCTLFLFSLLTGYQVVHGSSHNQQYGTKLFVFGDSYADTGNLNKSASSWNVPYGLTFPGKPAGRFSDGRVLTDFIARYVGIKSPVPYELRKFGGKRLRNGMNFAYGGTGVFNTMGMDPNMTIQIDFLEKLINDSFYTKLDLKSSLVLLSLSGNDYRDYTARGGSDQGLQAFITSVVNQLAVNLKRIQGLGVKKIAVNALQPLGCLPISTISTSFQKCNETLNTAVRFHNLLLQQAVGKLNNETKDSPIGILDLFGSFTSVLTHKGGSSKFETPILKPCCIGISNGHFCGDTDEKGVKMYTVCDNPKFAFFWDTVHPTQAGWRAVYSALHPSLEQIF